MKTNTKFDDLYLLRNQLIDALQSVNILLKEEDELRYKAICEESHDESNHEMEQEEPLYVYGAELTEEQEEQYWADQEAQDEQAALYADSNQRYVAKREDESPRYYISGTYDAIYAKALELEQFNYRCGNTNWRTFLRDNKEDELYFYVVWNSLHRQFAVEYDLQTIDEIYPHLTASIDVTEKPSEADYLSGDIEYPQ